MAQLLTAAAQANETYTGMAARDTANSLQSLTGAVRGVVATTQVIWIKIVQLCVKTLPKWAFKVGATNEK